MPLCSGWSHLFPVHYLLSVYFTDFLQMESSVSHFEKWCDVAAYLMFRFEMCMLSFGVRNKGGFSLQIPSKVSENPQLSYHKGPQDQQIFEQLQCILCCFLLFHSSISAKKSSNFCYSLLQINLAWSAYNCQHEVVYIL